MFHLCVQKLLDAQRLARPWDSPEAELTFQPKISTKSQQLMAEARGNEGAGGFLDRLDNDMRRREAKQKVGCRRQGHHGDAHIVISDGG